APQVQPHRLSAFDRQLARDDDVLDPTRLPRWVFVRGHVLDRQRIEQHEVGYRTRRDSPAIRQPKDLRWQPGHPVECLFKPKQLRLAYAPAKYTRERAIGARMHPR